MADAMRDAILNGFVDQNYLGSEELGPKILANNQQERIWQNLRQELYSCKSFTWAVAFITQDMLVPFKVIMADLAKELVARLLLVITWVLTIRVFLRNYKRFLI